MIGVPKVYIASTFDLMRDIEDLAKTLKGLGIEITREWWHYNFKERLGLLTDHNWYGCNDVAKCKDANFKAIDDADVLIFLTKKSVKFNGALVEVGYAIGKGKKVIIYGNVERSAMFQGIPQVQEIKDLLEKVVEK